MTEETLANQIEKVLEQETPAAKPNLQALLARAVQIKAQLEAVKPLYDELEQVTLSIVNAHLAAGAEATVPTGHVVQVVDNFAGANTVFRPAAVKRFELKIMTPEEHAYSKMSKTEKAAFTRAKKANGGGDGD